MTCDFVKTKKIIEAFFQSNASMKASPIHHSICSKPRMAATCVDVLPTGVSNVQRRSATSRVREIFEYYEVITLEGVWSNKKMLDLITP